MIVSEIKLYELLKARIGIQEAEAFVEILEKKVDQKFEDSKQILATKQDIANVRQELSDQMSGLRAENAQTKAELIKWMFIFWIGQLASFIAIAKFFFHQ